MRNINFFIAITLFAACLALPGCKGEGYSLAPVTGTATCNGEPVPKLKVLFSPKPIEKNDAVGPFSVGKTDAAGKFTLKTRKGKEGAFVGKHTVTFLFTDIGESAMHDLIEQLDDAQDSGNKEKFQKVQKKIKDLKAKLKDRPPVGQSMTVDIPAEGYTDLQLELKDGK